VLIFRSLKVEEDDENLITSLGDFIDGCGYPNSGKIIIDQKANQI
jgi:hypothetical protein